jgi:AraC-like DNA-binding protein
MTVPVPTRRVAHGFARERLTVLPRSTALRMTHDGPLSDLLVTDAGWFPEAADHYRERPRGAPEVIVILCSAGSGWCRIADTTFRVGVGDVVVIPAHTPHRYGATADSPWTIWWLHLTGRRAQALAAAVSPAGGVVQRKVHFTRALQLADETIRFMERGASPECLQAAAGCAWHLMGLLAWGAAPAVPAPVERALAAMADRTGSTVTVAELAALVNLSPSHFAAVFRKATGTSVLHHFIALKMAVAREMLEAGRPVGAVAQGLGFRDTFYFSRQFSRFHGISPSSYRDECRRPASRP